MTSTGRVPRDSGARRLVLMRHGRTEWNATGRAQGHADIELDDAGHLQAATAAPHVAALRPAALWSSDLARARQTAAYVEKETGLVAVLDPRLREYDVGERTGLTREQAGATPMAEDADDVVARFVPACRELVGSVGPGGTALAVTHGAALRVAMAALLGWPLELADSLHAMDNCALAVLDEDRPGALMRLVAYNATPDFASFGSAG